MKTLLLLATLVAAASARYEARFFWSFFNGNMLQMEVGNPPQKFEVAFVTGAAGDNRLRVGDRLSHIYTGAYNATASTTFKLAGKNQDGFRGSDEVTFLGLHFEKGTPSASVGFVDFDVVGKGLNSQEAKVGWTAFGRSTHHGLKPFAVQALQNETEQTVVFVFEPHNSQLNFGGVVFGDKQPPKCSPDFALIDEAKVSTGEEWVFEVKDITLNGTKAEGISYPLYGFFGGHNTKLDQFPRRQPLKIPKLVHAAIVKALGGYYAPTGRIAVVPCSGHLEIGLNLGPYVLTFDAHNFINYEGGRHPSKCYFYTEITDSEFFDLPDKILRNHCLRYDYDIVKIGFSARLSPK